MKKILIRGNKLFLDDGKVIYLTKEMFNKFSLKGKEFLDDNELNSLLHFRVKLSAYNLLVKRDYFTKEIKLKLRQKHDFPEIIDTVIDEFLEQNYLNDGEKAYSYAKAHQNYGPRKLYMIFNQMGLNKEIIENILEKEKNEQTSKIREQWIKLGNREKEKKIATLMRKGFLYRDIERVISSLEEGEEL